ncbi:MAG: dehydrogenase, partial [Verrucomicrobiae bacterium]|nr:dehydrogenase [Verrucomicrobiae bacterium]
IPTAVLANPEGVYVGNSTEMLFFTDEDDDGVADSRRVLYSGFGTEDTHHIIHTLRQGPAGRVYFNQSIYTHSHVETPYGYRDLQAGGVWQFRPETLELEVYARGMWNSWGLQFDRWGQSFQSDGAGFEGLGYSFPGAAFVRAEGYDKYIRNLNPGQPKLCGLEIIDSPQFPDAWQGLLVTCDFRGNRINSFRLTDSNSGFISTQQKDLVTSTHGAFRPIDLQHGPDGALFIADWYNPIIQHGEVDFRDERRDHTHGRIWRVTAKDRPLLKRIDFPAASLSTLLDNLKADNSFYRDHAKRELKQRGAKAVLPALKDWVGGLDTADPRYENYLSEALWVTQALDQVDYPLLEKLLDSENFKIRALAVRVLEERPTRFASIYDRMAKMIVDRAPRVRNEAIQVLRKLNTEEAAKLVVRVLDYPLDENLDFSLWNAMRQLKEIWLPSAEKDPLFFGANLEYLLFSIRAVEDAEAVAPLEALWNEGGISAEYRPGAMELLAERGSSRMMAAVLEDLDLLGDAEDVVAVFRAL